MRQKNENKIYELFFEHPDRRFTMREIELQTKIPKASVQRYLLEMKKEGIVSNENMAKVNLYYKIIKTNHFIEKIVRCGLIDEIVGKLNPSCIILFGSFRKGESEEQSDIDIFVECMGKKKISLEKFEKILGHKIDLFVESDINKINKNLFNNVVNGIKLYGSLKVK